MVLGGPSVPLRAFAAGLRGLTDVLEQIGREVSAEIDWVVVGLDWSSAITVVGPRPRNRDSEGLTSEVVQRFGEAAEELAYGGGSRTSPTTARHLRALAAVLGEGVEEIRLETAAIEAVIQAETVRGIQMATPAPSKDRGTLMGRVQTLQARHQLRFTLYDLAHDRGVSCYLAPGQEEWMRNAWGRLTEVDGVIWRDPEHALPLSIRQVTAVRVLDEPPAEAWMAARGAIDAPASRPAEAVIRELRDAG